MQQQIDKRGVRDFELHPEFVQIGDRLIGSSSWLDAKGNRTERHQVLTIRDGKIADMQVCGTLREAKRFAKRTPA